VDFATALAEQTRLTVGVGTAIAIRGIGSSKR